MKKSLLFCIMLSLLCLTSCTYTISMVHTEGSASDVVDNDEKPSVTATIPLNGSPIPSVSITPAPTPVTPVVPVIPLSKDNSSLSRLNLLSMVDGPSGIPPVGTPKGMNGPAQPR